MPRRASFLAVLVMLWCQSAFAQADFMGVWRPLPRNQDGSGMTGDIAGVPASDAAGCARRTHLGLSTALTHCHSPKLRN